MSILSKTDTPLLPPPAKIILFYAADGLSVWKDRYNKAGRPRTPSRSHWVPMFRQLVETYEGLKILQKLAETGMQASGCSADTLKCTRDAFRDISFRGLVIAALEDFAETAQDAHKIILPKPAPMPYPEETNEAPRPEPTAHATKGQTVPHRPAPRRKGPKFEPR